MQACSRTAVMGSIQQPIWGKGSAFPPKGLGFNGIAHEVKLNSIIKPCRSSQLEESLVTGRPPSSVYVSALDSRGSNNALSSTFGAVYYLLHTRGLVVWISNSRVFARLILIQSRTR